MYNSINQNLYENKFLQKLLANSPAFAKVINLKEKKQAKQRASEVK